MSDFPVFLGVLEELVKDKNNKEIMVNGIDDIWVDRNSTLEKTNIRFQSEDEIIEIAQGMARYCGCVLDVMNPIVHVKIIGHFHAHLIIPPIAMKCTTITIFNLSPESM